MKLKAAFLQLQFIYIGRLVRKKDSKASESPAGGIAQNGIFIALTQKKTRADEAEQAESLIICQ